MTSKNPKGPGPIHRSEIDHKPPLSIPEAGGSAWAESAAGAGPEQQPSEARIEARLRDIREWLERFYQRENRVTLFDEEMAGKTLILLADLEGVRVAGDPVAAENRRLMTEVARLENAEACLKEKLTIVQDSLSRYAATMPRVNAENTRLRAVAEAARELILSHSIGAHGMRGRICRCSLCTVLAAFDREKP